MMTEQWKQRILTVVVVPNLFLILALGVHDDFGKHLGQDVLEQLGGELEVSPDVTLFQDIQHIAWNTSFA